MNAGFMEIRKYRLWNFYLCQIPHGILNSYLMSLNYESHTYGITNYVSERDEACLVSTGS